MAFTNKSFTPAGGNARRGSAPQQFDYGTPDAVSAVKVLNYFNRPEPFENLKAQLNKGDSIYVNGNNDGLPAAIEYVKIFVESGGEQVYVLSALPGTVPGAGYAVDNILTLTFGTGIQLAPVKVKVIEISATPAAGTITALEVTETGAFSVAPTVLDNLVAVGGAGTNATVNVTLDDPLKSGLFGDIIIASQEIAAA